MGRIKTPLPGKMIMSALYSSLDNMIQALEHIEKKYGRIEFETDEMDFLHTSYYREEMGDNLKRKFFSFIDPIERSELADLKIWTNKLEEKFGEKSGDYIFRTINLDPGILTLANLTLASTKDFAHRIYLRDGIYAETTLIFKNNKFVALPWTYPDYTEPPVTEFLTRVRESLGMQEVEI